MADRTIEFGDREWEPRESKLTILEGPELEGPDLAFGQGWSNAAALGGGRHPAVLEEAPRAPRPGRSWSRPTREAAVADARAGERRRRRSIGARRGSGSTAATRRSRP